MNLVSIGFTGDFCPWQRTEARFRSGEWQDDLEQVRGFFLQNNLNIADLECPLTLSGQPIPKTGPHLRAHPDMAAMFPYMNIHMVATANNHFYDYGWEGMQSTYKALTQAEVAWLGSGETLALASVPYFQELEGQVFAFINVSENEWSTTQGNHPGVNPLDPVANYSQIRDARAKADYVVVIAHGGHEHYPLPSPRIKQLYRFFVEAGAAAVIAHHPHVVSGYEVYEGAPIFYSLGNFCFDWPGQNDKPWNDGLLVRLIFEHGKPYPNFELEWIHQNGATPDLKLVQGAQQQQKKEEMERLSAIIADDDALEVSFQKYCNSLSDLMLTWIEPYPGRYLASARKRGLLPSLFSKGKKQLLTNLIRCEAHRDVLLHALKMKT